MGLEIAYARPSVTKTRPKVTGDKLKLRKWGSRRTLIRPKFTKVIQIPRRSTIVSKSAKNVDKATGRRTSGVPVNQNWAEKKVN